jgi:hypothetical protein
LLDSKDIEKLNKELNADYTFSNEIIFDEKGLCGTKVNVDNKEACCEKSSKNFRY